VKWSRERTGNAFGSGKLLDEISRPLISYSPLRRETYLSPFSRQSIIIAAVVHGARAFSVLVIRRYYRPSRSVCRSRTGRIKNPKRNTCGILYSIPEPSVRVVVVTVFSRGTFPVCNTLHGDVCEVGCVYVLARADEIAVFESLFAACFD